MTAMTNAEPSAPGTAAAPAAPRRGAARRVLSNPLAAAALAFLVLELAAGFLLPLVHPIHPQTGDLRLIGARPGTGGYLLGGDGSGRSILDRLLAAIPGTAEAAVVTTLVAAVLGVPAGLIAGYRGKAADATLSFASNLLMTVPGTIILVALYPLTNGNVAGTMGILGVLVAPGYYRITRTLVMAVRAEAYVDAARVSGLSTGRILTRHVLVVIRAPIVILSAFVAGVAINAQAGLGFLGLAPVNQVTWGGMLSSAFLDLYNDPLQVLWPTLALAGTVGSLVLLGNGLRDGLDPGARARNGAARRKPAVALRPPSTPERQADGTLLEVSGLRLSYPVGKNSSIEVVRGVDLSLLPGEVLGLVGESGSGKTQTAFSILGLLPPEATIAAGSVRFDGRELIGADAKDVRELRRGGLAYVPQEPMSNLDPGTTIARQLRYALPPEQRGSASAAHAAIVELLGRVGIPEPERVAGLYPHQISGGMAQRVLIAGAIASRPRLLIADEPTTALDVTVQAEILDLLRDLRQEHDMSVLLVTHDFGVVADLCDRVAVMQGGAVVEVGTTQEIFTAPQHSYTRSLLDAVRTQQAAGGAAATGAETDA